MLKQANSNANNFSRFLSKMGKSLLLTEAEISELTLEFHLTSDQITEYIAEFKAYDTNNSGDITSEDLGIVNKGLKIIHLKIPNS